MSKSKLPTGSTGMKYDWESEKKRLAEVCRHETEKRWETHPELRWAIEQYREAFRNEELHGKDTAYYRGVIWALRNMYAMANNGCATLEIDASPDNQ